MSFPVIAIVGSSDSGKTRVAVRLVEILTRRGRRIAAIKHCPHGHDSQPAASDTGRLLAAGAAHVRAVSPRITTAVERTSAEQSLEAIAADLAFEYDLVIAEGFKGSAVPKVLVTSDRPLSQTPSHVIATVGEAAARGVPAFSFEQIDDLASLVESEFVRHTHRAPAVSLAVDGEPVELAEFPARALAGTIAGFVAALKGVGTAPGSIRVEIDLRARVEAAKSARYPHESTSSSVEAGSGR